MRSAPLFALFPLLWASLTFSARPPQQSASQQAWQTTEVTDSGRASSHTRFTLTGKFLKRPPSDVSTPPALAIDCGPSRRGSDGRFIDGNLIIGVPLKINYVEPTEIHGTSYDQKVFVQLRVDDAKNEKRQWTPGKEKTSAVFSKYSLKKILRAHTVEITTEDENGSPVTMQFDVPDSKAVAESCDVDTKK